MKKFIALAFLLATVTGTAQAMPLAPANSAANTDIIQVAGGCGAGWHRGPYGGCLRNFADPARTRLSARLPHRPRRRMPRQRAVISFSTHLMNTDAADLKKIRRFYFAAAVVDGAACGSSTNLCANQEETVPGIKPTSP